MRLKDMPGMRFGRLTVIKRYGSHILPNQYKTIPVLLCRCDCGNETKVLKTNLVRGATKSCGCLRREHAAELGRSRLGQHWKWKKEK